MSKVHDYQQKFEHNISQTPFARLPETQQAFLRQQAMAYRFTLQELRQLVEIAIDVNMWDETPITRIWPEMPEQLQSPKERRRHLLAVITKEWQRLRSEPTRYPGTSAHKTSVDYRIQCSGDQKQQLGLGYCPVASEKTRCCNLLTLDAVENCGFDCSYCSIQSFYHDNQINFDSQFADKLQRLALDPNQIYHIGTGQSSDSLMWGNQYGVLDALVEFARRHPNVILELKSKSKNVAYLLKNDIPPNIICTWSLNTPTIIDNEEHLTASLEERLTAARQVADRGIIVGFHLHPMVHYDQWRDDYAALFENMLTRFRPEEVAMVSLGTLTFIKSVIKQIRGRDFKSKILQLPLTESDGKLSYPEATKLELFTHAYQRLKPWHDRVFFYLCMENQRLWRPVLGYEYEDNFAFEAAMKQHYLQKIHSAAEQSPGRGQHRKLQQ